MIIIYKVLEMQNLLQKQILLLDHIFYQLPLDIKINMSKCKYYLFMIQRKKDINKNNSILIEKIVNIDLKQGELNKQKMKQKYKLNSNRLYIKRNQYRLIENENTKLFEKIKSAKTQYNKKLQLKNSSEFEQFSRNISQNARRHSNSNVSKQIQSKLLEQKSKELKARSFSNQYQYSDEYSCTPNNLIFQFQF
ncbi:unnamed protein product [Paramecium sonneborni]|uniref:Uncharacterized protein n=1 Tax=Paramecium sonneborni TaxID=65129 RepID=A0A8S1KS53_9CILI|nr:unnamed protein product [Paramecium sonneborni]